MKEIKFRQAIWHPITGGFVRWHYWGLIDTTFVGIDTGWYSPTKAIENSYQYTGLHDKNGGEIYAGDIIETQMGNVGSVEYSNSLAYYIEYTLKNNRRYEGLRNETKVARLVTLCPQYCKAIGNIYENPELLEAK